MNKEIQIIIDQKKIKIPPKRGVDVSDHPHSMYPWLEMSVGQSFVVYGRTISQLASAKARIQQVHNIQFTSRLMTDGGVRTWRIK